MYANLILFAMFLEFHRFQWGEHRSFSEAKPCAEKLPSPARTAALVVLISATKPRAKPCAALRAECFEFRLWF